MKISNTIRFFFAALLLIAVSSCQDELSEPSELLPTISFNSATDSYQIAIDQTIIIEPIYENAQNATFSWSYNDSIVSELEYLSFSSEQAGDYYFELEVTNTAGSAYKELKISVVELVIPNVDFSILGDTCKVLEAVEFTITPNVSNCEDADFLWTLDGDTIATSQNLSYTIDELGCYNLELVATNQDGQCSAQLMLCVMSQSELPFSCDFEQTEYNISSGRAARIKCWNIENDFGGDYLWELDGEPMQRGASSEFIFDKSTQGTYQLTLIKYNTEDLVSLTQQFSVKVCPEQGTYKRASSSSSQADSNKVYEFNPAPGQFVNNGYTASTMAEACAYIQSQLDAGSYISLGGYGGYVVVGFDHSISNSGGYDLEIKGNAFATSCEPGIVMVMQDENGDGLPNDTWYELKGSETTNGTQISDYSITYYRPEDGSSVSATYYYTDNYGGSGYISKAYFSHDFWPAWIDNDRMVFYGTCLVARNEEVSPNYWVNQPYDWGYVDNYSTIDMLLESTDDYGKTPDGNHFRISDAIDYKGDAIDLDYIDFVKVYSATNSQSGWQGEISTELLRITDFGIVINH